MSSRIADLPPAPAAAAVVLDGHGLRVADVVRLADGAARPEPAADAMRRVEESWNAAPALAATGCVHGRSTGVGANRTEDVPTEAAGHGLRPDPVLPAGRAVAPAEAVLDADHTDRPLTREVGVAAGLPDRFTDIWKGSMS